MGELIDLREELYLRLLARRLVEDLGVPEETLEEMGGVVDFAVTLMRKVDALPEGNGESICEDHPELFELLRKRITG